MERSRRDTLRLAFAAGVASMVAAVPAWAAQTVNRLGAWRRGIDGQRRADLGDGHYLNPVIAGDRPDPTVLRDGRDYYATFASFDYYPGLVIWHSRDLVNWTPVGPALAKPIGSVHAPELVKHDGRYFLYFAALALPWSVRPGEDQPPRSAYANYVVHSRDIEGPWSDPIDIGVPGLVDPGHVVGADGKRYLFFADGYRVQLDAAGLAAVGTPRQVYQGWPIPKDMINEGFSLAGPKLMRRGDWFYLFSAQGGTAGPANGHMVVVARSRSVDGPWENAPRNPLVRADARDDPWWSRGHASPVEGPDGRWWIVYHAFEKNLRSQGRPAILEPIEWGADGWPKALGGILADPLPMPATIPGATHGTALSGPFTAADFGQRLTFYQPQPGYGSRATITDGALTLTAQGHSVGGSSPLAFIPSDRRYEISVEIEARDGAQAGLLLFYDDALFCGIATDGTDLRRYKLGHEMLFPPLTERIGPRFHARLVFKEDVASFYVSADGIAWTRITTQEVSGYNMNMAGPALSLRPALFASGRGSAVFHNLHYNGAI